MTPPPQRFPPPETVVRNPSRLPPGDRGPTKSLGPLQGMGQPGISKAETGGSGKPRIHKKPHPSRKRAEEAAAEEGPGPPINHPHPKRGRPHFHPADEEGEKIPGGTHHEYPP